MVSRDFGVAVEPSYHRPHRACRKSLPSTKKKNSIFISYIHIIGYVTVTHTHTHTLAHKICLVTFVSPSGLLASSGRPGKTIAGLTSAYFRRRCDFPPKRCRVRRSFRGTIGSRASRLWNDNLRTIHVAAAEWLLCIYINIILSTSRHTRQSTGDCALRCGHRRSSWSDFRRRRKKERGVSVESKVCGKKNK